MYIYMIDLFVSVIAQRQKRKKIRAKTNFNVLFYTHTPQPYRDIQLKASNTLQEKTNCFIKEKRKKFVFFVQEKKRDIDNKKPTS